MRIFRSLLAPCFLVALAACSDDSVSGQAREITVRPNPATREALLEYQQLYPDPNDPTGLRVTFIDLPAAPCIVTIFDHSGECVEEIHKPDAETTASWNLVSGAGEEVGTGTYHFAVHLEGGAFIDRGTFFVSL